YRAHPHRHPFPTRRSSDLAAHTELDPARPLTDPRALCDEARTVLRPRFLAAYVGITGANFIIAETGSSIIVTNEGNGDLTQILRSEEHTSELQSLAYLVCR